MFGYSSVTPRTQRLVSSKTQQRGRYRVLPQPLSTPFSGQNKSCNLFINRAASHHTILTFFLFFILSIVTVNAERLIQPYLIKDYDPDYIGRVYSGGKNSPVFKSISENKTRAEAVLDTISLISQLDSVVSERRESQHAEACNVIYTSKWRRNSFRNLTPILQIGSVAEPCNSRVDAAVAVKEGELSGKIVRNARRILVRGRNALYDATLDSIKKNRLKLPDSTNWTNGAIKLDPAELVHDGQTCSMDSASAYYHDKVWHLRAAVTNHPPLKYVPDKYRQLLIEYVPIPPSLNESASKSKLNTSTKSLETIQIRQSDGDLERASNILLLLGGKGFAGTMPDDKDFSDPMSPISQAFSENLVHIDQASDSVTISNIAILALPMAMNLIPVAFIADVTAIGTLLYILLTDVLSTIPFLVKGIELILWSAPRREVVISFHAGDEALRLVEVWAVRCRGVDTFRQTGVIFIIVSTSVLLFGISFEIWAKLHMSKLQKVVQNNLNQQTKPGKTNSNTNSYIVIDGPFGNAMRNLTSSSSIFGRLRRSRRRLQKQQNASNSNVASDNSNTQHQHQHEDNKLNTSLSKTTEPCPDLKDAIYSNV